MGGNDGIEMLTKTEYQEIFKKSSNDNNESEKCRDLTTEEILDQGNRQLWRIPRLILIGAVALLFLSMLIAVIAEVATHPICSIPRNIKWYNSAEIYRINVKAFYDSDGDGVGDLKGIEKKIDYLKSLKIKAIWIQPFKTNDVFESVLKLPAEPYPELSSLYNKFHDYDIKILISFNTTMHHSDLVGHLNKVKNHIDGVILEDQDYPTFLANYKNISDALPSDVIIGMHLITGNTEYKELDLVIRKFECTSPLQCSGAIKQHGNHFGKKPYRAYTSSDGTDSHSRNIFDERIVMSGWSIVLNYGEELKLMKINKTLPMTQPLMNWNDQLANNGFSKSANVSKGLNPDFFPFGYKIQTASSSKINGLSSILSLIKVYNTKTVKWGENSVYYDNDSIYYTITRGGFQSYFVIIPFNTQPISKNFAEKSGVSHGMEINGKKGISEFDNFFINQNENMMIFTY